MSTTLRLEAGVNRPINQHPIAFALSDGHQKQHPACKKLSDEVLAWLSVWKEVQIICI